MVDYWNTLLKDEPAWSLLVSILSLLVSVWASTVVARRSAKAAVVTAFDLANRQELSTRLGRYRDKFSELLDFLPRRNAPTPLEWSDDETLTEATRNRLAAHAATLASLSQFMGGAFTTELQLLSTDLLNEAGEAEGAVHRLHDELHYLGSGNPMIRSKEETEARINELWQKAEGEVSVFYKRIHRKNYF